MKCSFSEHLTRTDVKKKRNVREMGEKDCRGGGMRFKVCNKRNEKKIINKKKKGLQVRVGTTSRYVTTPSFAGRDNS